MADDGMTTAQKARQQIKAEWKRPSRKNLRSFAKQMRQLMVENVQVAARHGFPQAVAMFEKSGSFCFPTRDQLARSLLREWTAIKRRKYRRANPKVSRDDILKTQNAIVGKHVAQMNALRVLDGEGFPLFVGQCVADMNGKPLGTVLLLMPGFVRIRFAPPRRADGTKPRCLIYNRDPLQIKSIRC